MIGFSHLLSLAIVCGVFIANTSSENHHSHQETCRYEETLQELLAQQRQMYEGLSQQLGSVSDEIKDLKAELFPPPPTPEPLPHNESWHDCADVYLSGKNQSGLYKVSIQNFSEPIAVYCNMDRGGGWTVFQRRKSGGGSFDRTWKDYKEGFGDLNSTHWLGNDILAAMTSQKSEGYRLRVEADGSTTWRRYGTEMTNFRILDESQYYQVIVDELLYEGGEGFSQNIGMNFTTKDRDNDGFGKNCAILNKGGWWYTRQCGYTNLNAIYASSNMYWYPFDEFNSLFDTLMEFRPMNFKSG